MIRSRSRLVGNSLAILVNQVTQNATALILSISIARILGPYELGQYALAFGYYYIFMAMSSQGLKTLLTRELAKFPEKAQTCLVSSTLLQLIFSGIGYLALVGLVALLPYRPATSVICYMVGAALIPYGVSNVTEAIFQSQEKMHLIAISTVPIYIARLILMFLVLRLGYGINYVGLIFVGSEVLILAIEWLFVRRVVSGIHWKIDWSFIRSTVKAVRPFLVIEGVATFQTRMQLVFLSLLAGEVAVGLYGAVTQLIQPFQIMAQSVVIAAFPRFARANQAKDRQRTLIEQVIELLFLVAMPFIVAVWFVGEALIVFIYRDTQFVEAAPALRIVVVGLIAVSLTRTLSYLLVANGLERVNLREVITTTSIGAVLSLILVSAFGLIGAAIAVLLIQLIACSQYVYVVYTALFSLQAWHMIRRPLALSAIMAALFAVLVSARAEILWILVTASAVYAVVVGIGGLYEFRFRRTPSVTN